MLRIRPATPADHPLIRSIAHRTWPATFGHILSPEQIDYMLDWMYSLPALAAQAAGGHTFLLLYRDGEALGYAGFELHHEPAVAKLHKLYLLPAAQGSGGGRLLVEEVLHRCRAAGVARLRLHVNYQNPAVDFYAHLGFAITRRVDVEIGRGYRMEDFVMERPVGLAHG